MLGGAALAKYSEKGRAGSLGEAMSDMEEAIRGRSVFVTGHTGFTGCWLTEWLLALECRVAGYSLAPETSPNLFSLLDQPERLVRHDIGDICEYDRVKAAMAAARPSVVFHLAAQPLVRRAFRAPLATFASNVLGTASVLEAARNVGGVKAVVCVTTDKVYENREWPHPYRESDALGGKDPYSASKACAELVAKCYRQTMVGAGDGVAIATARGGNIIGGGDWSEDRIVPDYYRALAAGAPLVLRNPDAVRPWQHVLSACHGYLAIAGRLISDDRSAADSEDGAWNIGPSDIAAFSVGDLIDLLGNYSQRPEIRIERSALHEAQILKLDVSKAASRLGFSSPWSTEHAVRRTAEWYAAYYDAPERAKSVLVNQLQEYRSALAAMRANHHQIRDGAPAL